MKRWFWRGEWGGALPMAMAFMVLAVPLVTAGLGLASTLSVDSRVKTGIVKSQYCAMGASNYALYRLVYEVGYAGGLAIGVPSTSTITLDGRECTQTVTKLSQPSFDPPPPPADNSRRLQTTKTVSPTTAAPGVLSTFRYTIIVENRDDQEENLQKIHDDLPLGLSYVSGSTLLYDPPSGATFITDPSIVGQELTWNLAGLQIRLQPGQSRTLVFDAQATLGTGNYCNQAWAEPGGAKTASPKTQNAIVVVGSPLNDLCEGAAAMLTKTVTPSVRPSDTPTTYTYIITLKNVGTVTLHMSLVRDLLPAGFTYVSDTTSGDITSVNPTSIMSQGRQRLDWSFTPQYQIQPSETRTLVFQAQAAPASGEYYNDVWVTLDEFASPVYSWPTALVQVMGVFKATATDGESTVVSEVWIGGSSYAVAQWDISR